MAKGMSKPSQDLRQLGDVPESVRDITNFLDMSKIVGKAVPQ